MNKEVLLQKIGDRILEIRQEKGITQKELAHTIDKDQQSIQRLEKGKINPTIFYLYEVSVGLGVDLNRITDKL